MVQLRIDPSALTSRWLDIKISGMETRKTTISLPVDLWETVRIRAVRERTTMSELVRRALEAYELDAPEKRPSRALENFLHAPADVVRGWVVEEADEPEDFDDADVD